MRLPEILRKQGQCGLCRAGSNPSKSSSASRGKPIARSLDRRAPRCSKCPADHIVFLDQFVDQATLLDFIAMCDVYVTPYLNEAQMTSGTLAYSFGSGPCRRVSTPYWHARELLADGRGILVPFGDCRCDRQGNCRVIDWQISRAARPCARRAYTSSRSMTWENVATKLCCGL